MDEGVVTIMFTDVVGSTELAASRGDVVARELVERQRQIVRERVDASEGREIDSIGDGFMIAFTSTRRALTCAIEIQQELERQHGEDARQSVRLRIGLNVGEVLERDGHPFGAAVNAASRVAACAGPGEVLATEAVKQLAGTTPGVSFRDRGRVKLKGFEQRWRLYQVLPAAVAAPPAPREPRRPLSTRVRRRRLLAGGLVLAAGALAGAIALVPLTTDDGAPPTVVPNTIVRIDPATGEPTAVIEVGDEPDIVVASRNAVWVLNDGDRTVSRVDTRTYDVLTVGGGLAPCGMAADPSGDLWVASCTGKDVAPKTTILRLDAGTGDVKQSLPVAAARIGTFRALAYGGGAVWIGNPDPESIAPQSVTRVDVRRPTRRRVFRVGRLPAAMTYAGPTVWVANLRDPSISRVWPTGQVQTIRFLGDAPASIAIDQNLAWVGDFEQSALWRFDVNEFVHDGKVVLPVQRPSGVVGVAAGAGGVWATAPEDGTLWRIDPETNRATPIRLGYRPAGVAVAQESVWVAVDDVD